VVSVNTADIVGVGEPVLIRFIKYKGMAKKTVWNTFQLYFFTIIDVFFLFTVAYLMVSVSESNIFYLKNLVSARN